MRTTAAVSAAIGECGLLEAWHPSDHHKTARRGRNTSASTCSAAVTRSQRTRDRRASASRGLDRTGDHSSTARMRQQRIAGPAANRQATATSARRRCRLYRPSNRRSPARSFPNQRKEGQQFVDVVGCGVRSIHLILWIAFANDAQRTPHHLTLAGSKFGFSMMPKRLPNGSVTAATLMPPPTSAIGSSGVAPSASNRE